MFQELVQSFLDGHLTPVRMAIINKSTNNKCWRELRKKGNTLALLVGM